MGAAEPPHVRDAGGGLVDVQVADVARPKSAGDVQQSLQRWKGQVCIGGARYSMGGQIAAPGSLHLDMRGLNKVIAFDPALRVIRVQAGMRWRDVQDAIDPHDLSVRIM
ncbi:MAG: FAD-binding oxidoreductase [Hydrocarboniphaga sp.]|nr:FAD-binding oxidoreductase [Hydrocarboniphaga sp.]